MVRGRGVVRVAVLVACGAWAACGAGACGGDGGGTEVPDASVPPSGELVVASWNLKEFPQTIDTPARVADQLLALDVDLLAAEEIGDANAFAAVATATGLASYVNPLATAGTGPQLGLLWRAQTVTVSDVEVRFVGDAAFPRPALRARVALAAQPLVGFTLWVVHLKAGTAVADEQDRLDAVLALEAAIRADVDGGQSDDEVLVVGDFNEAAGDARAAEVFAPFLAAPTRYTLLTWPLAQAGTVTFLPAGIMLDHVAATQALSEELGGRAPEVPPIDQGVADYTTVVSDHLPVLLRVDLLP